MNKDLKRRLYAIALAGIMFTGVKTTVKAETLEDVDMSYVDIDEAMKNLIPDENTVVIPASPVQEENKQDEPTEEKKDNITIIITPEEPTKETEANTKNNPTESVKEPTPEDHQHTFSNVADDVINQVTPSCTKGGSYDEVYYCSCGGSKIVHYDIAAPGHKWDNGEKKNITESGYEIEYHCTNKGCTETKKEYYKTNVEEPTTPTVKPTEPKKEEPTVAPKTGDDTNLALLGTITAATGLGLFGAGYLANKVFEDKQKYQAKYSQGQTKGKYLSKRR